MHKNTIPTGETKLHQKFFYNSNKIQQTALLQNEFSFKILGLKNLLSQHPFLFRIDGDLVYLTTCQAGPNVHRNSDYVQETKDFFKQKLQRYGVGVEVPLNCLAGHFSQAQLQVRAIAG